MPLPFEPMMRDGNSDLPRPRFSPLGDETPSSGPAPSIRPPRANASSSGSQTETPYESTGQSPSSNVSPQDIRKWIDTGSFGTQGKDDEDEDKNNSNVTKEGDTEDKGGQEEEVASRLGSCFRCGGKLVWAQKGEFYLVCKECEAPN